jgi:type I restriction enzyme S subunit
MEISSTKDKKQTAYKDTPIGKIPADWEVKRFNEIVSKATLGGNYENSESNNGIPVIKMGNIDRGKIVLDKVQYLPYNIDYNKNDILKKGDLLFNTRNTLDLVGKVSVWNDELPVAIYNSNLLKLEFKSQYVASNFFMNYLFNSNKILSQLKSRATGTTSVAAIYTRDLYSVKFPLPPLPEQQRIAEVLSTWDQAIQCTEQLILQKEQRKKWLMQNLLTGKIRLKGFSGEWKEYKLGDFIKESRIPSKCNDVNRRITVKLNLKGIEKREVRGSEAEDATIFFIRKKGQFIYGKQNIHKGSFGIIPDELDGFESSQDIPSFDFNDNVIPEFFLKFMSQESFYKSLEKISTGTGSKRVHPENLYKVKVKFPHLQEQTAIAEVLQTADKEIELLKAKAEKLKEQKKGLMQQLLTGRKRLL